MLTYKKLSKREKSFQRLIGVSVGKFDEIVKKVRPYWEEAEKRRLSRPDRERAIGAGGKYRLQSLQDKCLVLFMYFRTYVTMEFLSFMFDLDRANICRLINRLQPVMNEATLFSGDKPKRDRRRRRKINNLEDFLKEYPELEDLIVDATEQRTQRPKRKQKAYYSGKKKCHTLKNQIVINKQGEIIDVTKSSPGRHHDKRIWDESKISKSLPSKIPITSDSGYQGIKDDFPNATLPHKKRRDGPELTKKQKRQNRKISRERILVENVIGRMKIFKILSDRYRGNRKKHSEIFEIVAYVTNVKFGFVS
jgi:hypothetical protein